MADSKKEAISLPPKPPNQEQVPEIQLWPRPQSRRRMFMVSPPIDCGLPQYDHSRGRGHTHVDIDRYWGYVDIHS